MYSNALANNQEQDYSALSKNSYLPLADIFETETQFVLKLDMPDVAKENLDITLDHNLLAIHGKAEPISQDAKLFRSEYEHRDYFRSFKIAPDAIDVGKIDAKFDKGILTLTLSKSEQLKPRKIPVSS